MATRSDKIANVLRVLSIILTIASLVWAVYATDQRNKAEDAKDSIEAILMQQAEILLDARAEIAKLNAEIHKYEQELDSLLYLANQQSAYRDSILREVAYRDYIIQNLKNQLDESITIIDVDDDEQLRLFIEWTTLE